ncbi:hypothetical protein ACNQR7_02755 [Mycolicibacterium senegalense]|uniref:hypothetical protein n=1 Tax=Mycolicibacterium senegalense TaxID=1796 RepID=UPI003AAC5C67
MSDAQKLIADVQRQHRRTLSLDDGLSYCQGARAGQCNYLGGDLSDFEAHVAAEIDKALGGLTRETRTNAMSSSGMTTNYNTGEIVSYSDIRRDARWASGWKEASQ